MFNEDTREWIIETTDQKIWAHFKIFFHRSHRDQRKAVTTTGKGDTPRRYKRFMAYRPLSG